MLLTSVDMNDKDELSPEAKARIARLQEASAGKGNRADIARACKTTPAAVTKWFKKGVEIDSANLFPLADLCEVEPRWLALGDGPKIPPELDPLVQELCRLWDQLDDGAKNQVIGFARGKVRADPPEDEPASSKRA